MKNKFTIKKIAFISMMIAVAVVLDLLDKQLLGFAWLNGGSVSTAMIPIIIVALYFGILEGVVAGLIVGTIQLTLGAYVVHPVQFILDYTLAFGLVGMSGIFRNKSEIITKKVFIILSVITAGGLRFLSHYFSGIIFFGEYAPDGQPVWLYSLIYNGAYMLLSVIICVIILILLLPRLKKILEN